MDPQFWLITIPTLVVFFGLAAFLLIPIWRFLDREEEVSKRWTPETVKERLREQEERVKEYEKQNRTENSDGQADSSVD